MCLVAFAINASARWPLVIASNRDEYFNRPTLPLTQWQTESGQTIISGRDLRAGGTWLGTTPNGRIALLTNVRQMDAKTSPLSRGDLLMRWLENNMNAAQFMARIDPAAYAGFNLVIGDFQSNSWTWLSNRSFGEAGETSSATHRPQANGWCSRQLTAGIYGLSNAALDTPWPKTVALKAALSSTLTHQPEDANESSLDAGLWAALANNSPADKHLLPDTGLPVAFEQALSSAFVDDPLRGYGTRCSTLLVASTLENQSHWRLRIQEKTYAQNSEDQVTSHEMHWLRN